MIRARHTFAGRLIAGFLAGPLLGSAFREIRFIGDAGDDGLPVLMLANHFCWWDGIIQYRLNREQYRRRLYVMMLEKQLEEHPLLARCGCFSVRKGSRSILETLDYCTEVMRSAQNMLLIFPQGEIQSLHRTALDMQPGVGYLLDRIPGDYNILLNINLPDYGSHRKPSLNCYCRTLRRADLPDTPTLAREWNRFYTICKNRQIDAP